MTMEKKRFFKMEATSPKDSLFVNQSSDDEWQTDSKSSTVKAEPTDHIPSIATAKSIPIESECITIDSDSEDLNGKEDVKTARAIERATTIDKVRRPDSASVSLKRKRESKDFFQGIKESKQEAWTRYIGSVTLQAWATRPTTSPLRYKQKLEIKRLIPKKMTFGRTKDKSTKFGDSAVIRLFSIPHDSSSIGREIGRIPTDMTDVISPLLDLNIIECDATVILDTDTRLSIGDSFYIQITFRLSSKAFSSESSSYSALKLPKKNTKEKSTSSAAATNWNFAIESDEESALRLRQASLVRLFDKLNIKPDSTNGDDNKQTTDSPIEIDADESSDTISHPIDQLNVDQLKQFYLANQQSELLDSLPETTTPPSENFKLELRPYQRKGLSWMLSREKEIELIEELSKTDGGSQTILSTQTREILHDEGMMNPLWKIFRWPVSEDEQVGGIDSDDKFFYANMYSGELSTTKPIIKSLVRGGILADEMGLGKTISTLSLVTSVPQDKNLSFSENNDERYASYTSLIVVPMSLLSQWQSEFDKTNNNSNHRCIVYYGDQTMKDLKSTLCQHQNKNIPIVILTTYGTILNEYTKASLRRDSHGNLPKTGIYSVKFFRIILDEGHTIRNRSAKTTKAIYELSSTRKWVLTGTPVINRLDDLYSIVKFLELEPWCNFAYWKTFVTLPFEQRKIGQTLDVVNSILQPIFLRRTKNMKQKDGKPLVELPDKEVVIEQIEFNEKESKLYEWFKLRAAKTFREGLEKGELLKKYTQILSHILRLRQVCCHMDLVGAANEMPVDGEDDGNTDSKDDDAAEALKEVADEEPNSFNEEELRELTNSLSSTLNFTDAECSICTSTPIPVNEMGVTECGHIFCLGCILEHITFQAKNQKDASCPNCRNPISKYKLFKVKNAREVKRIDPFSINKANSKNDFILFLYDPDRASSKIQALVNHLRVLNTQHPGEQVVVFSQFSSYLDIIEKELNSQCGQDINIFKFDGRLHMNERKKVLEEFAGTKLKENESISKTTVLLLSLKAGGVGLNLTSASRAFMMDPWWSPSVEDQAIDRIHRIGQVENVKVIRFIVKDSIEEKMLKIQERKKQIGEAVAADEEERSKRRIEEIQMLFEE